MFDINCIFSSETVVPSINKKSYPTSGALDDIVRYTDNVQMHSAIRFLLSLKHPPVVIDVGAHHGFYAVIIGLIVAAKGGTLVAAEPTPSSFAILEKNIRLNKLEKTVYCENIAVGSAQGKGSMSGDSSESFLIIENDTKETTTDITTLSRIMSKHNIKNVDLLMIDVEGAELPVLQGWPQDQQYPSFLLCELHPNDWDRFGYSSNAMTEFLDDHKLICIDAYWRILSNDFGEKYVGPTRLISSQSVEQ